jgi:hypothetical protein
MLPLDRLHARLNEGRMPATSLYAKPLPRLTPLTQPFWDHSKAGHLAVQACAECGDLHFPPSPVYPKCLSAKQEWRIVSGRGTLMSWVVFHRDYWDAFKEELPYPVCLVKLEEGPLLATNFGHGMTGEPKVGAPVHVVFERAIDEITLPQFVLD